MQLPITAGLAHDETPAAEVQGRGPASGVIRQGSLSSVLKARTPHLDAGFFGDYNMLPSFQIAASNSFWSLQDLECCWMDRRSQGGREGRHVRRASSLRSHHGGTSNRGLHCAFDLITVDTPFLRQATDAFPYAFRISLAR